MAGRATARWLLFGGGVSVTLGLLVGSVALWWVALRPGDGVSEGSERRGPRKARKELAIVEGSDDGPRPEAAADAPNVVLVIGCTFRRDQTTVYSPQLPTTPFLAQRAADGVVFDDLVNAAPWTKAASTAIITGHHAVSLGMTETDAHRNQKVLPDDITTLAEAFRAAGYQTYGLTTNPNVHSRMGFAQGFDRYAEPAKLWRERMAKTPGHLAVDQALEWVADTEEPFFLQVLLVTAHAPFPREPLEVDDGAPELVGRYRAGLQELDAEIAQLVEGISAAGHGDDTVFMVVNDHGEGLEYPPHHGKGHGRYLSSSALGGIGVVWGQGVPTGGRVRGLASQIDLAPTLLSMAGVDGWEGPGVDLSPVIRGEDAASPRTRTFADTWFRKSSRAAMYAEDMACQLNFRSDDVVDRHGHRFDDGCFDRRADPAHEHARRDPRAERELRAWRAEQMAAGASRGRVEAIELDDDLDRQLELLGYVDDDDEAGDGDGGDGPAEGKPGVAPDEGGGPP